METREEARRRWQTVDADERLDRMVIEVANGTAKADSLTLLDGENELWDGLVERTAAARRAGRMVWLGGSSRDE